MAASVLKIGISQNPNCDNLIGFPKSGHICHSKLLYSWNISSAEIFKDYQIKTFHDLIFEVKHLDISIITLTIILSHILITV